MDQQSSDSGGGSDDVRNGGVDGSGQVDAASGGGSGQVDAASGGGSGQVDAASGGGSGQVDAASGGGSEQVGTSSQANAASWAGAFRGVGVRGPLAATVVTFLVGYLQKLPCHGPGWPSDAFNPYSCYSDVPFLFRTRGFIDQIFPYASDTGSQLLEYPVLTGLVMDITARFTHLLVGSDDEIALTKAYFNVNVLLMLALALVMTWAVWQTLVATGGRPGDAYLVAASPALAFTGTINWDMLVVAATALALLAWVRQRPELAGVLIGVGTAAKLYPVFLLGPILVVCLRERRIRAFVVAASSAVAVWSMINFPIAVWYPEGWFEFWRFNQARGADFGSFWYGLEVLGAPAPAGLNLLSSGGFVLLCLAVAALGLLVRRPPTVFQLFFLVMVAFLVTNKVYSPQYVVWLLPLAVLARSALPWPKVVVPFMVWQTAELLYWLAVWRYFMGMFGHLWLYSGAIFVRIAVTLGLAALVVRDMVTAAPADVTRPEYLAPVRGLR